MIVIRFVLGIVLVTACRGAVEVPSDGGPPPLAQKRVKPAPPPIACEEIDPETFEEGIARVRFAFVSVPSVGNGCDRMDLYVNPGTFDELARKHVALDPHCRSCTYERVDGAYASELELVVRVRRASNGFLTAVPAPGYPVLRTARYQTVDAYVRVTVGGRRQRERLVCKGSLCFLDPSHHGTRPAEWGDVDY